MRTFKMSFVALALMACLGLSTTAFAAETAGTCPATQDAKACPAAKTGDTAKPAEAPKAKKAADKPKTEVKCEMAGKLEEKTGKNKKGEEVKFFAMTVSQAKADDGKCMEAMKGKTVRVAGKKGMKLADYAGKDVTVKGLLVNGKRLIAESVK